MERRLNSFSTPAGWEGVTPTVCPFDDYMVDGHPSLVFHMATGDVASYDLGADVDMTEFRCVSLSMAISDRPTFVGEFTRKDDAQVLIKLNGKEFRVPISDRMQRVVLPYEWDDLRYIEISPLYQGDDFIVLSDFKAWTPELPADMLWGVKCGLEREIAEGGHDIFVCNTSFRAGDKAAMLSDWPFVEEGMLLRIGTEYHQVASKVDDKVTFLTTYSGDAIQEDMEGVDVYVSLPVSIGFYDRELELPGIAVWYQSPRGTTRSVPGLEQVVAYVGDDAVIQKEGQMEAWTVVFEVMARNPELIQMATTYLRKYLGKSQAWANGLKLMWIWKDQPVDNEPVADYEILPRTTYKIEIEVNEGVWEWKTAVGGYSHISVHPKIFRQYL